VNDYQLLCDRVVRPALDYIGLSDEQWVDRLAAWASQPKEVSASRFGPYGMTREKIDRVWREVLTDDRDGLRTKVRRLASALYEEDPYGELDRNWSYATALARLMYEL
jgi:hypothetical protein